MKKTLKILSVSLLMTLIITINIFAAELNAIDEYSGYETEDFTNSSVSVMNSIFEEDDANIESTISYFEQNGYESMAEGISEICEIKNSGDIYVQHHANILYETEEGNAINYVVVECVENVYLYSVVYDSQLNFIDISLEKINNYKPGDEFPEVFNLRDYSFEQEYNASSIKFVFDADKIGNAAVNTVIGLGVVFGSLIFISIIIGLFKFISPEGRNFKAAPVPNVKDTKKTVADKNVKNNDNELVAAITAAVITDETQLVAAITAAICAYEGVSADSFVVRTIKKRKW